MGLGCAGGEVFCGGRVAAECLELCLELADGCFVLGQETEPLFELRSFVDCFEELRFEAPLTIESHGLEEPPELGELSVLLVGLQLELADLVREVLDDQIRACELLGAAGGFAEEGFGHFEAAGRLAGVLLVPQELALGLGSFLLQPQRSDQPVFLVEELERGLELSAGTREERGLGVEGLRIEGLVGDVRPAGPRVLFQFLQSHDLGGLVFVAGFELARLGARRVELGLQPLKPRLQGPGLRGLQGPGLCRQGGP